jgi:hypothetical protein
MFAPPLKSGGQRVEKITKGTKQDFGMGFLPPNRPDPGAQPMKKKQKKRYTKPRMTKIRLEPQEATLGFCKTMTGYGPAENDCALPGGCSIQGS